LKNDPIHASPLSVSILQTFERAERTDVATLREHRVASSTGIGATKPASGLGASLFVVYPTDRGYGRKNRLVVQPRPAAVWSPADFSARVGMASRVNHGRLAQTRVSCELPEWGNRTHAQRRLIFCLLFARVQSLPQVAPFC